MKKVLIIAYIFPPIGGSGVQRTLKFARYLPQFGWQPIVVCGDDGSVFRDGYDPTLLSEIPPEVVVYRTPFRSPLALRRRVQRTLGIKSRGQADPSPQHDGEGQPAGQPGEGEPPNSMLRSLMRLLSSPLAPFEFPPIDAALYWALSIVPLCLKIIRQEQVDVIFTTSFPYSDHVAGYLLKRLTGKPWVADFRDPFSKHAASHNMGWRLKVDGLMEKLFINSSNIVVAATPTYTEAFRSLAPQRESNDFITITNGFDPEDFVNMSNNEQKSFIEDQNNTRSRVLLAHIGMIYDGTSLPFFEASRLVTPEILSHLDVHFIGGLPPQEQAWVLNNKLSWNLTITERVSHHKAILAMKNADAVLLPIGIGKRWFGHLPGKLFEYLKCGVPIFLVGPEGDAAKIVRDCGVGCVLDGNDRMDIAQKLSYLIKYPAEFRSKYYKPNQEVIRCYDRNNLTSKLSSIFESLSI